MRALIALFAFSLVACSKHAEQTTVAGALEKLADGRSRMVLYTLDPRLHFADSGTVQAKTFHGYDIVGRADITDASERRALVLALASGAHEDDGRPVPLCFNPRHGLHVDQAGRSIDFVICFECIQVQAYGFKRCKEFIIGKWQQPTFDDSCRRHQLPYALE